jgi:hypothetical protein
VVNHRLGHVACIPCEQVPGLRVEIARLTAEVTRLSAVLNKREDEAARMRSLLMDYEARLMASRTTWGAA